MANPPFNPYAPPTEVQGVLPPLGAFRDFDIGLSVTQAWQATKRYFPLWLGVGIVGFILSVLAMITIIGYFVVVPVIAWGGVQFLLNMVDGRAQFDDLFSGFRKYMTALGRMLFFGLIFFLAAILSESIVFVGQYTGSTTTQVVGWIVYAACYIGVLMRLYFAPFFMVDRDMSVVDALGASWNMTQGKTLKLFGFLMVTGVIAMSGVIACLVGVVFSITMSYAMFACAYRQSVPAVAQ